MNQSILNRSRNDKFKFVMDLPTALKKRQDLVMQSSYNADQVQFTTFGSPVPSIKVNEIKVPFGGQVYNASSTSRPSYDSLSLKFLIDNGYQNYWILWKWLNLFNDSEDSITTLTEHVDSPIGDIRLTNPMSDFTTTFSLFGLDEFNNKIIEFKYTQAFITSLSPIEYSFQTANEIICTATFVFNQLNISLLKDINTSNC
jgi:hypothetical protein